ncbi:hypothetical protein BC939DRAFT_453847 [Gamsiella multidivaricata]|uniref:uncharacterized protein n=1 Tax=Gamsiella multidivaricata TaxID=101098 RepID=UPI0022205F4A|nr:uncharacterized protein BC939DRAFT_453847 [Gamsiella multidivaricata]KAI7822336.1 hypothetical protein BC939DRAFT_453847 [Gamsiella multidivaricata]
MQSGNLRARRRVTRAYSVASNSTYSSPEGISRPAPSDCRVAPAATEWNEGGVGSTIWRPQATSAQTNAALHAILDKHDHYNRDSTVPGSGTRRGSHSTLSSRAITAVIGMKQRQQEHGESSSSDDTSIRPGCKLASRSIRSVNSSDEGHERSSVQDLTTAAAPIPIQNSTGAGAGTGSGSIQRPKLFKSPTPPPSLLSPSLTTTKVSHSSSTVHGVTPRQGGSAGMVVHVRKESGEKNFDEEDMTTEVQAKQTSTVFSSGASQRSFVSTITDLPNTTGSPDMIVAVASCGCERHYKHAILSTVVPIPLEKCFELLFSGQGAGLGNELMVETKRAIDGSTDVKTTPWMKNDRECCIASQDTWEGANRRLEYSIPFKVPMLARATASCVETQEILQYDDRVIRVQTESRLPYIPFGEQFSTLCQICLLRDPSMTGNTRIKCFVEVLFRKTILWGNKIEAASVESADGFLKEFIRRLIEVPTEVLLPEDGEGAKSGMANMNVTQPELSTSPSSRSVMSAKQDGLPGMSPAHELLSQQYSKTLLVGTRRTRPSMDYVRPHSDSVLLSKTVTLDTVTVSGDLNITTAATVKPSKPAAAITAAAAVALWDQLVRKSIVIFAKLSVDSNQDSNAVKTGAAGPDNATQESVSKPAGDSSVDQSGEAGVADEDDKLAQDSAALSPSAEDARDLTAQPSKLSAEKTHVRGRILPRMVLVMLALGMTVFLVNVWRLFNVTSSMLHVVSMNQDHSRFLSSNGNSNVEGEALGSRFGGMLAIRQLQTQATLIPIQIQTEMLKAEISELVGLLEQARDVWQETQEQFPVREELSGGL